MGNTNHRPFELALHIGLAAVCLYSVVGRGLLAIVVTGPSSAAMDYGAFNVTASYVTAGDQPELLRNRAGSPITDSDLHCLSELPVEKLLRIRKTLRYVSHMLADGRGDGEERSEEQWSYSGEQRQMGVRGGGDTMGAVMPRRRTGGGAGDGYTFEVQHRTGDPQAASLIMDNIKDKVGYDDGGGGGGWMEEKPSKVQKVFQLSVTTLAFLAFGGYLLCMIVQAIKSKGTTYYHPALMPMVTATGTGADGGLSQISQISIRKRRPVRIKRGAAAGEAKKANQTETRDALRLASPSPDELYNIMVMAAEGYVRMVQ